MDRNPPPSLTTMYTSPLDISIPASADAGIEISSGDVYIVVSDGGGFLSIANDQEPATPEYYDRNWVSTGYGFETIFDSYANLAGDFGILAGFIGAPGSPESVSYAVHSI